MNCFSRTLLLSTMLLSKALELEYPCEGRDSSSTAYLFAGYSGDGENNTLYQVLLTDFGNLDNSQRWTSSEPEKGWSKDALYKLSNSSEGCLEFGYIVSQDCLYGFESDTVTVPLCEGQLRTRDGITYTIHATYVGDGEMTTVLEERDGFEGRYLLTQNGLRAFVDGGFWFDNIDSDKIALVYERGQSWASSSNTVFVPCAVFAALTFAMLLIL